MLELFQIVSVTKVNTEPPFMYGPPSLEGTMLQITNFLVIIIRLTLILISRS